MKNIYFTLLLCFFFLLNNCLEAQVTIGSGIPPVSGSLLDLKEYNYSDTESDNGTTSNKGLILPKVRLTDINNLVPMFDLKDSTTYTNNGVDYTKVDEDAKHKGLIVYNIGVDSSKGLVQSLYFWNGTSWVRDSSNPWNTVGTTDPSTSNTDSIYLKGKAIVGGTTVADDASLSVYGSLSVIGNNGTGSNPSAILDIKSDNQGILIPRISLQSSTDANTITSPARGLMVYNTNTGMAKGEGLYMNYGTQDTPNWLGFIDNAPVAANEYKFAGFESDLATKPIDIAVPVSTTRSNLDLGLSLSITIPARTESQISVNYSLPIGQYDVSTSPNGYIGVKFMKQQGTAAEAEFPAGSRKYSIGKVTDGFYMVSVSATVVDPIINNTDSDITVVYKLYGYVENLSGQIAYIRFNMWDSELTSNYNWGAGTMTSQLYTRKYTN